MHPKLWEKYLCQGKFTYADGQVEYDPSAECTGPWEPPDELLMTPQQVLQLPLFTSYVRNRNSDAPKGPVYGLWDSQAEYRDWQPSVSAAGDGKICSLRKFYKNRYTIEELRDEAKLVELPYWADMSYEELCTNLGKPLVP